MSQHSIDVSMKIQVTCINDMTVARESVTPAG